MKKSWPLTITGALFGIFASFFLFYNLSTALNTNIRLPYEFFIQLRINVSTVCVFSILCHCVIIAGYLMAKRLSELKTLKTLILVPSILLVIISVHFLKLFSPTDITRMFRDEWLVIDNQLLKVSIFQCVYFTFVLIICLIQTKSPTGSNRSASPTLNDTSKQSDPNFELKIKAAQKLRQLVKEARAWKAKQQHTENG